MENPVTVSLVITLIGMAVVFVAMALIYGSMQLLTAVAKDKVKQDRPPASQLDEPAEARQPDDADRLRAAAIAVAVARARRTRNTGSATSSPVPSTTPWGEYYRHRQLAAGGRGRIDR